MGFVRQGVRQVFERVDLGLKGGEGQVEEVEKRLQHFMKKVNYIAQAESIALPAEICRKAVILELICRLYLRSSDPQSHGSTP